MKIRNILTVALLAATSSMALTTAAVAETAETKIEWWPKKVDLTALRQNEYQQWFVAQIQVRCDDPTE